MLCLAGGSGGLACAEALRTCLPLLQVAKYNVDDMCVHQWAWASKYPTGYEY